jgi:tetratricopeptide (TPR) repeat protein
MLKQLFALHDLLSGNAASASSPATPWQLATLPEIEACWSQLNARLASMMPLAERISSLKEAGDPAGARLEAAVLECLAEYHDDVQNCVTQGRWEAALDCCLDAYDLAYEDLGPAHQATIDALFTHAQILTEMHFLQEADAVVGKGLALLREFHPTNLRDQALFLEAQGLIEFRRGDYSAAYLLYEQGLGLVEATGSGSEILSLVQNLGRTARALGKLDTAHVALSAVVTRLRQIPSASQEELSEAVGELGALFSELGRYQEAEPLLQEALESRRARLPAAARGFVVSLHNLARLYELTGRDVTAQELRGELDQWLDRKHPHYVAIRNESVPLLLAADRWQEAVALLRELRPMAVRLYTREHPKFADVLESWGRVSYRLERFASARRSLGRVAELRRRLLGEDAPETAAAEVALAQVEIAVGELDSAARRLEGAVPRLAVALGARHASVGESQAIFGALQLQQGDIVGALDSFTEALKVRLGTVGPEHPLTAVARSNLAAALAAAGHWTEANNLWEQAVNAAAAVWPAQHASVLALRTNLVTARAARELTEDALSEFQVLDELYAEAEHLAVSHARLLNNWGCVQERHGEHETALMTFRRGGALAESLLGEDHLLTAILLHNEGACLGALGQRKAAEAALLRSVAVLRQVLSAEHPDLATAEQNLGALRAATIVGRPPTLRTIFSLLAA